MPRRKRIKHEGRLNFDSRKRVAAGAPVPARAAGPTEAPVDTTRVIHDEHVSTNGERLIQTQDYFRGYRIYRAGSTMKISGGAVTSEPFLYEIPGTTATKATTRPQAALECALGFFKRRHAVRKTAKFEVVSETRFAELIGTPTVIRTSGVFEEAVRLRLEVFASLGGVAELAWVIQGALSAGIRFEVVVSATRKTARVLSSVQTNLHATFKANMVWFPAHGAGKINCPIDPISPTGYGMPSVWWSSGRAEGPNVSCHDGMTSKAEKLGPEEVDTPFVWCNVIRDFFHEFGFDGRLYGFEGDDPIWTRRFARAWNRGAECLLDGDGFDIYLDFYGSPFGGAHSAMDPSIVIHEYTHAVTNRLVGGGTVVYAFVGKEAEGLDEGYCDFFTLSLLDFLRRRDSLGPSRILGEGFQPGSGVRNYEGFKGKWSNSLVDKYAVGKAWCGALLDARDVLARRMGNAGPDDDAADRLMWRALVMSLRAMPPSCSDGCRAAAKNTLLSAVASLGVAPSIIADMAAAFQGRNL